ncbi:hypothetical protein RHSIM_Rhsim12G0185800 [Rhododendron simsii]|uniref:Uncharacterized protein n=1 Tax=Rhododendron simsii TaxID=118357 RepID=A0A834L638_RHOSS|nr:hypothetical protein RHSIM_Rhsim12G0185800 [Rhododendron simsii]
MRVQVVGKVALIVGILKWPKGKAKFGFQLKQEIEKTIGKLKVKYGLFGSKSCDESQFGWVRVPLRSFIFGIKLKKKKSSIFSFMHRRKWSLDLRSGMPIPYSFWLYNLYCVGAYKFIFEVREPVILRLYDVLIFGDLQHAAHLDLDTSTSFFGVYDSHAVITEVIVKSYTEAVGVRVEVFPIEPIAGIL